MTSESLVVLPARPACCQVDITVPGYPDIITESSVPISIPNSSAFVDTTPGSNAVPSSFLYRIVGKIWKDEVRFDASVSGNYKQMQYSSEAIDIIVPECQIVDIVDI